MSNIKGELGILVDGKFTPVKPPDSFEDFVDALTEGAFNTDNKTLIVTTVDADGKTTVTETPGSSGPFYL